MPIDRKGQQDISIIDGNIVDERTGLFLPSHIAQSRGASIGTREIPAMLKRLLQDKGVYDLSLIQGFYTGGVSIYRDESTLVMHTPIKGSDASELLLSAFASGEISNVGISPVVMPQLLGLMRHQQAQAQGIDISLSGRETPTRLARQSIARFNDSPLGASQAIQDIVYNLRVFCRGCPVLTVPVTYDMDVWDEYGLTPIPILKEGQTESEADTFYLQVDWERIKTPIPFLADPLRFRPSGLSSEWPYWFLAEDSGVGRWVLLHNSHVIPVVPGNSLHYGSLLGTSSVWSMLSILSEEILVIEERVERKISAATNGLLGISGVNQTGDQIAKQIELQTEIRKLENRYFASDYTILSSSNNKISFTFLPLRQSDGIDSKERREFYEDALALAFNEPLTAVVSRGGIGFATNASEQTNTTSDTGISAILSMLEVVFGAMYPRVMVTISRQNDPSQRLNVETLKSFASAIQDLNASTPDGVLTTEEIRALISRDLFEIPEIDKDTVRADATADSSDGDVDDTEKTTDRSDEKNEQGTGETEVEATIREAEQHIQNVRYELEPIEPRGADDPIPAAPAPNPQGVSPDSFDDDMPDYEGLLDAEPIDDEEFPPADSGAEESESWLWLIPLLTYFNESSGRSVDEPRALELRDDLALIREASAIGLAPPLAVGDITIQQWVDDMRDLTRRSYVQQYMLGRGGQNMLAEADYDWLTENINLAYSEIDYLAERMAMGAYSEAQVASYSQTVLGSAVQGYEAGRAIAWGIPDLPDYPGSFRLDCRGRCRCTWRHEYGFDDRGLRVVRINSYWELNPRAQHCRSCLENNASYYPFVTELT